MSSEGAAAQHRPAGTHVSEESAATAGPVEVPGVVAAELASAQTHVEAHDRARGRPVLGERLAGDVLRAARRTADLSQRQLADVAAVSHTVIARVESGARQPLFISMLRLLAAAGCSFEFRGPAGEDLFAVFDEPRRMRDGRRYPAHLDVYEADTSLTWWTWRWAVPPPEMSEFSYRLDRHRRDKRRRNEWPESVRLRPIRPQRKPQSVPAADGRRPARTHDPSATQAG